MNDAMNDAISSVTSDAVFSGMTVSAMSDAMSSSSVDSYACNA